MLSIQNLKVALDAEAGLIKAIDGLSLAIDRGQTFALVGESGCGKSMTALALLRLLPENGRVTEGHIEIDGEDTLGLPESSMRTVRGRRVSMIFQEPSTSLNPVMRVGDQIVEVIETHTPLKAAAAREKAIEWLWRVGIPQAERRIDEYPFRLSGGQKQRVMIAIALAAEPEFLVADEPTTALDVTIQKQILDLLQDLQRERGLGLMLITHDLAVVAGIAHQVALMYAGQIVEVASAEDFFAEPKHPYARLLLNALPDTSKRGQSLAAIPGTVPPLWTEFTGCRFTPRCDRARSICPQKPPPLHADEPRHAVRCLWYSDRRAMEQAAPQAASVGQPRPVVGRGKAGVASLATSALLEVRDLSVRFPIRSGLLQRTRGYFTAVETVSFQIGPGQTLALVGESGCGKTTTGKAIVQLLRGIATIEGQARLEGRDLFDLEGEALRAARRDIQIIFQDPFASLDPRMRVYEVLEEGLLALRPELDATARRSLIKALADQVGLGEDALGRYPHEFSGGQRQRIAIARALAVQPKLIICDEPTSALDVSVQAQILNLLRQLQQEVGVSYLFITHNIAVVEYVADAIAVMRAGRIEEQGACEEVLEQPRSDYTKSLLAAVPRLGRAEQPS
ncbi:MAG TPA: dipeptide ABC transporter ATP-binding protein [Burkholderiaceae bacterium]|nr:dipeptide ABC transporter ATP-binding protein [Burkholderiaceae bacterium]